MTETCPYNEGWDDLEKGENGLGDAAQRNGFARNSCFRQICTLEDAIQSGQFGLKAIKRLNEGMKKKRATTFDMDFALRTFKSKGIQQGRIIIYGMMGLYTEAVKLALRDKDSMDLAKDYARKPKDEDQ